MKKFKPLHKDVLVKVTDLTEKKTDSGIFMVETKSVLSRPTSGVVDSLSDKITAIKVGDTVHWDKSSGIDLEFDDGKYCLLRYSAIIGVSE